MKKLDGKVIVAMHEETPTTPWQDTATANANVISDALAACDARLIDLDRRLVWVADGQRIPVSDAVLQQLINNFVAVLQLVNQGSAGAEDWQLVPGAVACPHLADVIKRILTGRSREDGGLIWRVPKVQLSEQQQSAA